MSAQEDHPRLVLVGRSWDDGHRQWAVWDKPVDEVIATLTERLDGYKPGSTRFVVMEVSVRRRVQIGTEVKITEATEDASTHD